MLLSPPASSGVPSGSRSLARMAAALDHFDGPLAKVDFTALGRDWQAEIAQIYTALGLTLTDAALQAMGAEQARAANGAHHAHRSQIAGFSAS